MSVLIFTGESGAGKSTLATYLCKDGGVHISDKVICRTLAYPLGYERSRDWVQAVGFEAAKLAVRERTDEFVGTYYDGSLLIIDGAYDSGVPALIRERFFEQAGPWVVAVETPRDKRVERLATRMGGVGLERAAFESRAVDGAKAAFGAAELAAQADLKLDGSLPVELLAKKVTDFLATKHAPLLAV